MTNSGQALTTLIVIVSFAMTVIATVSAVMDSNMFNTSALAESRAALMVAESGMENALIRILRNPSYSGETLPVGGGSATINLSGSGPIIITSQGRLGNHLRTVEVSVGYSGGMMTVTNWHEK